MSHSEYSVQRVKTHRYLGVEIDDTLTWHSQIGQIVKLVRQSQIVQSVMQDCQYVLSHLLPVCNLLVQGPKIAYSYCLS